MCPAPDSRSKMVPTNELCVQPDLIVNSLKHEHFNFVVDNEHRILKARADSLQQALDDIQDIAALPEGHPVQTSDD